MRIILTLREPIARIHSYLRMQLRLGWSPIDHMGTLNPIPHCTRMHTRVLSMLQRCVTS